LIDTGTKANGAIAFSPDGAVLYLITPTGTSTSVLTELDPLAGTPLAGFNPVTLNARIDGLGVRPSDGVLFASGDGNNQIYTIQPGTWQLAALPDSSGAGSPSDLDFVPTPLPPGLVLLGTGALGVLAGFWRQNRRRQLTQP
jgi:hypothetical protein